MRLLVARLGHLPGSEIILVENGSTDGSGPLCLSLAATLDSEEVAVRVTTSAKGLGFAWRRGMAMARGETFVLTAADLPFGFTDLDGYLGLAPRPLLVMGSKTHPESQIETPVVRRAMSAGFGLLRAGLDRAATSTRRDRCSSSARWRRCCSRACEAGDYLIGAEINLWAVHEGVTPVEVPVVYTASGRSTVSPLRDSVSMAAGLLALRRRLADEQRPVRHAGEVSLPRDRSPRPPSKPRIRISAPQLGLEVETLVLSVLRSGHLAQGPMVERFEALCTEMSGTAHAVAVVNGTVALDAALAVLDIGPGQEVITSPFTFAATINAILRSGASVRFADIRADFTIDPASVAALIGAATTAIMPVHLYGLPCDMSPLISIAAAHGLAIVEDAAQAHAASVDGRPAGSFGLGCFSFYATKNVTSGEGGCVTTDDSLLRRATPGHAQPGDAVPL